MTTTSNFSTIFFADGSKFVSGVRQFGTLVKGNKIFDGEFKNRKLHGSGTLRTINSSNNLLVNDFIGNFHRGKKNGEGQRFYDNGIYEGDWKRDERSGRGIMWFNNGEIYLGEWRKDVYEGSGVLIKANGNRFEGSFSNGVKHGEGIFFHCLTGQVQKGVWMNDVCKCSLMQDDELRFRAKKPTPFPIPEVKLQNPLLVVAGEFHRVVDLINAR